MLTVGTNNLFFVLPVNIKVFLPYAVSKNYIVAIHLIILRYIVLSPLKYKNA